MGDEGTSEKLAALNVRLTDVHKLMEGIFADVKGLLKAQGEDSARINAMGVDIDRAHKKIEKLAESLLPDVEALEKRSAATFAAASVQAEIIRRVGELEKIRTGWWSFWHWLLMLVGTAVILKALDWILKGTAS